MGRFGAVLGLSGASFESCWSWKSLGRVLLPLRGSLGALLGPLGSLLEPLGAILGRLGAKFGGLGATFGALPFIILFLIDFGNKKGAQREAFGEPKRSKIRSKKEVQI